MANFFSGMMKMSCDKTVQMDKYLDTSRYYIYQGAFGRMTGKYRFRSGGIEETPDGGNYIS